ncbi:invasion protein CiaB [Helicobacter sp. MIT 05-5294]|uniref:invasion protein CiaB n=1 Tax=Helicobacter sp. MIT 05-5294 TaxID=1548150 RepID=UPI00051FE725|nr:invasion protein CiaB [Helicobacter sp. MIT 05-5294]TLD87562.1 ciab protein [Helicobacter sp. MIT 05-5294]
MTEADILQDIVKIYRRIENQNKQTNALYESIKSDKIPHFLESVFARIPHNRESLLACLDRVVALQEAPLMNVLQSLEMDEEQVISLRMQLLKIARDFHMEKHKALIMFISKEQLLSPFLRALIQAVHQIGLCFNDFFMAWQKDLILGINRELNQTYNKDLQKILEVLKPSLEVSSFQAYSLTNILTNETLKDLPKHQQEEELTQEGEIADRSYSVPVLKDSIYQAVAYAEFFKEEFAALKNALDLGIESLTKTPEVLPKMEQKNAYLKYFKALRSALMQTDTHRLLDSWRLVDKAWMEISTPLQIGHPLEYYEDHFRKAVAPEWDLRIARIYEGVDLLNPEESQEGKISKESMLKFYQYCCSKTPNTKYKDEISACVEQSLLKTQSYGGLPALFYGAELNGLFSAQVVPNDEKVSKKYGKKIFYFPDRVRELALAKPFMLLTSKTFPKKFLDFNRELLFFRKEEWYKVYEISTIGHEFGHILWVSSDSELQMNLSGQFKNIEEFKATMGGLTYYFLSANQPLLQELICNTIARAVGLIAYMKEDEVLPYYCESLIHLEVLFSAGILRYKGNFDTEALEVKINEETMQTLKKQYLNVYRQLVMTYLEKQDAKIFLDSYTMKDLEGNYKPKNEEVRAFVEDYYLQYQKIGQVTDTLTSQQWQEDYKKQHNLN